MTAPILVPETPTDAQLAAAIVRGAPQDRDYVMTYRIMLAARPEALKRLREAELAVMDLAAKAIMDDRIGRAGTVWFRTRDRAVPLADAIIALAAARKEAEI